jgi:ketosteroid isomerase-like protein
VRTVGSCARLLYPADDRGCPQRQEDLRSERQGEDDVAEHPNVQRVRDAYDAFTKGDLDGALKDLAPDGVFHFTGEGPNAGDHKGKEAISTALVNLFTLTGGSQVLDIKHIFADDHHAVVLLHETATRTDGATLDVMESHVLALDEQGRITDLWDVPDDPEAHDRFFDGR